LHTRLLTDRKRISVLDSGSSPAEDSQVASTT
jgi:hypothetical protein